MRAPMNPLPRRQNSTGYTKATINKASNLDIKVTISKPRIHNHTSYRAMERKDGVVIENPRYRPSTPEYHRPRAVFEPMVPYFEHSSVAQAQFPTPKAKSKSKAKHKRKIALEEDPLRGIRTFDEELRRSEGRSGYNEPVQCGRDGYNGPYVHNKQQNGRESEVMRRYLREQEPWTVWSTGLAT